MNTRTIMLQTATSGLTGRREQDIAYLKEQIVEYSFDEQIVSVLRNVMRCLVSPGMSSAVA